MASDKPYVVITICRRCSTIRRWRSYTPDVPYLVKRTCDKCGGVGTQKVDVTYRQLEPTADNGQ